MTPDKLVELSDRIPRDQEIVLFCTCPSEATAARMALKTARHWGFIACVPCVADSMSGKSSAIRWSTSRPPTAA
jgi:acetylornithine/succinyldiaminopimelate/putrescine aminotransferase